MMLLRSLIRRPRYFNTGVLDHSSAEVAAVSGHGSANDLRLAQSSSDQKRNVYFLNNRVLHQVWYFYTATRTGTCS